MSPETRHLRHQKARVGVRIRVLQTSLATWLYLDRHGDRPPRQQDGIHQRRQRLRRHHHRLQEPNQVGHQERELAEGEAHLCHRERDRGSPEAEQTLPGSIRLAEHPLHEPLLGGADLLRRPPHPHPQQRHLHVHQASRAAPRIVLRHRPRLQTGFVLYRLGEGRHRKVEHKSQV